MRVKVEVTKEDIKRGIKEDCLACPVARAVKRLVKRTFTVSVSPVQVGLLQRGNSANFLLPKKAERFIDTFDFGDPVRPFSFFLNISDQYLKEGVR